MTESIRSGNSTQHPGILDRIFFVDLAEMQRRGNFKDPVYACHVGMMMMFARLGLPMLTALCIVWLKIERALPDRYWIEHFSRNQTFIGVGIYVLAFYSWLYRRYMPYAYAPSTLFVQSYDTAKNRYLAKLSLVLAVAFPVLGWFVLRL